MPETPSFAGASPIRKRSIVSAAAERFSGTRRPPWPRPCRSRRGAATTRPPAAGGAAGKIVFSGTPGSVFSDQRVVAGRGRMDVHGVLARLHALAADHDVGLGGERRGLVDARAPDPVRGQLGQQLVHVAAAERGRPYSTVDLLAVQQGRHRLPRRPLGRTPGGGGRVGGGRLRLGNGGGGGEDRRECDTCHRHSHLLSVRPPGRAPSSIAAFTSCGLALPPVFLMTWPTNQPMVPVLPPRYVATCSGLSAITSSTARWMARLVRDLRRGPRAPRWRARPRPTPTCARRRPWPWCR